MSNLVGTNLRTPKSTYAYMHSMLIRSFASFYKSIIDSSSTNDFVQEKQPVAPDEQL